MNTLIIILLPLVISSLGFLTYRHPPIARQILIPLLYVVVGFFLLLTVYNTVQSSVYYKAIDATRVDNPKQQDKEINIDSLYKANKSQDSINLILQDYRCQREKSYEIEKSQTNLKYQIKSNIQLLMKNGNVTYYSYSEYCFASFLIIIVLYGLSFLFDNIYNKEKVSDTNKPTEQTE